jgi:hypothetical protein
VSELTEQPHSDRLRAIREKYLGQFEPTEEVDGHYWGKFTSPEMAKLIPWESCLYCTIIRRADKQNKPCKGPHRIGLRTTREAAEQCARGVADTGEGL